MLYPQTSQGPDEISPCSSVSGAPVSVCVSVIVEEVSPLLSITGVQEMQQENSSRECGLTNVSTVL